MADEPQGMFDLCLMALHHIKQREGRIPPNLLAAAHRIAPGLLVSPPLRETEGHHQVHSQSREPPTDCTQEPK